MISTTALQQKPKLLLKWELGVLALIPVSAALTLALEFYFDQPLLAGFSILVFAVSASLGFYVADQMRWRVAVRRQFKQEIKLG